MTEKKPTEQPKKFPLDEIKTDDLAYSLEVKLVESDKDWFIREQMVSPSLEQHDPVEQYELIAIIETLKKRIPAMSQIERENLRNSLSAGPFREVKKLRNEMESDLAQTYRSLEVEALKQKKEKVENIIRMQKSLEEILSLIEKKSESEKKTSEIQDETKEKTKEIKPSQD